MSLCAAHYDIIVCCQLHRVLKLGRDIKIVTKLQKPQHVLSHSTDTQMVGHAAATNTGVWVVIFRPPIAQCAPAMLMAMEVNAYLDHVY